MPKNATPSKTSLLLRLGLPASVGVLMLTACPGESNESAPEESATRGSTETAAGPTSAKVTAVTGPAGLTSPDLAAGTFLGKDAALHAGQQIATPKGTLAEIALDDGRRIRLNEDTAITLATDETDPLQLTRGELVVMAGKAGDHDVVVNAGDDRFAVHSGEAQVRVAGDTRRFAVIHGHATLSTAAKTVELSAGESLETPLDEPDPQTGPEELLRPELSLRSLDDTGWARTFDAAARMADSVPRGVGSLTARRPGSSQEQQKLRLTDHAVTVNISGRIAHTEVEQAFFNDQGAVLEGIYRFPMPGDGSMSGLGLLVGNTWMEGEIVEKQRARRIFSQIVDATIPRDPALLEWERGNIFKLRIFPIPGRGERRVRLSYTQVLPVVGGKLRYRYPMGGAGATGTPIDNFAFTVKVDGDELDEDQLANISTPMLALERRDAGNVVELHTERDHFLPTFDLGVDVPVSKSEALVHSSTHLDRDGQAYFMVAMQPEFEFSQVDNDKGARRPVNYAFVLDRSHSTTPELWTTARGVVDALTELLDKDDRFTVLACDTACDEHAGGLQAPSSDAVEQAQRFLTDQDLAGASDVAGSLMQARDALARDGREAAQVVVYLGDGVPTSGEMSTDGLHTLLGKELPDTRVLAVALGARSDLTALGAVVSATSGDLIQADARDDLRSLVRELRLRAEVPALRDVEFDLPDGMALVRERNTSAVRPGDTILLAGKLSKPVDGRIRMRATGPDGPIETSVDVHLSATRTAASEVDRHLPRTWAQMQVAHLTQTKGFAAKDEIVALSKAYNVLSRHTALLVLENDAMYREFNVVRGKKDTDGWDGSLAKNEEDSGAEQGEGSKTELSAKVSEAPDDDRPPLPTSRLEPDPEPEYQDAPEPKSAAAATDLGLRGTGRGGGGVGDEKIGATAGAVAPGKPPATPPPPSEGDLDDLLNAREENRRVAPAEELSDLEDEEDEGGEFGNASSSTTTSGSSKSSKPKKDRKPSPTTADDPSAAPGGWGGAGRGSRRSSHWKQRSRQLRIRAATGPSARELAKISSLRGAVQTDPTRRTLHGQLVRTALRAGHPEALAFAQAWAEVDPDHANALRSLADALAATGDPLAARAYDSVVEIIPFSASEQEALARAFEAKGDFTRSCSHRRAVVSIEPADASAQAELVACLQRAGRLRDASQAADAFINAGSDTAEQARRSRDLDQRVAASKVVLHGGPQLRATLTWAGAGEDLDIAVVDSKGRRLSTLHPADLLRVIEGQRREELTMKRVSRSVFIEITRRQQPGTDREDPDAERGSIDEAPLLASLELRAGGSKKSIPVRLDAGTERVAKVFWSF